MTPPTAVQSRTTPTSAFTAVTPGRISAAANALALEWARARLGADAAARAVERCRAAGWDVESGSGWVPLASHVALLQALEPDLGAHSFADLGRENAGKVERVVPGAGLMLRFANPKRLLSHAPTLWGTYVDAGRVRVDESGRGHASVVVERFRAPDAFWESMMGFLTGLLERVGARDAVLTRAGRDDASVLTGTWR